MPVGMPIVVPSSAFQVNTTLPRILPATARPPSAESNDGHFVYVAMTAWRLWRRMRQAGYSPRSAGSQCRAARLALSGLIQPGACSKRTMNWETPSSHCKRWVATRARWRGPGLRTPAPSVLSSFPALSVRPWCCPSLVKPMPARPTANVTNRIRRSPAMTGLANVAAMPFEVQCRMVSP
jgi:hypothetical protein